jgi:hypothetical protein
MAMTEAKQVVKERVFTVELNSRSDVKNLIVQNGAQHVVIEGTVGALKRAEFVENTILELVGTRGVLRVDLARQDLTKHSPKPQDSEEKPGDIE